MFIRPTNMAEAFINAAVKVEASMRDDHHRRASQDTWVTRRVIHNCERGTFGLITERDSRPVPPQHRPRVLQGD